MTLQQQIRSARMRTLVVMVLFFVMMALTVAAVRVIFGSGWGLLMLMGAIGYAIFGYVAAGSIVAAAAGAHKIDKADAPELFNSVENAAIAAGLAKTPDIYIIDDPAPNAFAAGRTPDKAYVAATTGILALLDKRELEGVMAHEMAHVRNRDVRLMTLAAVLVGVITMIADMLMWSMFFGGGRNNDNQNPLGAIVAIAAIILAPIGAALLQMSLSRRREFLADATAAELTGDPEGLARALWKLGSDQRPLQKVNRATAHLWIESPLRDNQGLRSGLSGLFDTHPPLQVRIDRLQEMGGFTLPPVPSGAADQA
ncbi:MAG: M48 family metalloprotease [Gaiellales bacterium]